MARRLLNHRRVCGDRLDLVVVGEWVGGVGLGGEEGSEIFVGVGFCYEVEGYEEAQGGVAEEVVGGEAWGPAVEFRAGVGAVDTVVLKGGRVVVGLLGANYGCLLTLLL